MEEVDALSDAPSLPTNVFRNRELAEVMSSETNLTYESKFNDVVGA